MTLSPQQSRAARGWLDWSQQHLANVSGVSLSTVRDFEKGRRTPIGNNLAAMARAFETAGVHMISDAEGMAQGITIAPDP